MVAGKQSMQSVYFSLLHSLETKLKPVLAQFASHSTKSMITKLFLQKVDLPRLPWLKQMGKYLKTYPRNRQFPTLLCFLCFVKKYKYVNRWTCSLSVHTALCCPCSSYWLMKERELVRYVHCLLSVLY